MQTFGDLEDLEVTLGKRVLRKVRGSGHCSALVKLLPKNLDLMISQVTWNDFNAMLRVFKLYSFDFHKQETQGNVLLFVTIVYCFTGCFRYLVIWKNLKLFLAKR